MNNELADIKEQVAVQLKGSLFTLTVLQLFTTEIEEINDELDSLQTQLPNFFQNTPVVIDLTNVIDENIIDFHIIANALRNHRLVPVGIRNGSSEHQQQAIAAGLAILPKSRSKEASVEETVAEPIVEKAEVKEPIKIKPTSQTKLITRPVRSGQQIYAKSGDLIVMSGVSNGAELLSDGHIHVYGALRGRALAGIQGNTNARIFCCGLDAELVSIAGYYCVKEDMKTVRGAQLIQIYLDQDNSIRIEPI